MSTRQVQVERASRGKVLRLRFGASIFHVVGLDLADDVFMPGSTEMRPQWQPRIARLLEELKKAPSTLRLSYIADLEDKQLVDARLAVIRDELMQAWDGEAQGYELTIEPEVFWRRGGPPAAGDLPAPQEGADQ
jgi:large repetitive protein